MDGNIYVCPVCSCGMEAPTQAAGGIICPKCGSTINTQYLKPQASISAQQPKNSLCAIWSLVLGLLSIFCCGPLTSIPAIICGHIGLSNIKNSNGTLGGKGMCIAGIILGWVGILLAILSILFFAFAAPLLEKYVPNSCSV
jgi:hypothetical protein